MTWETIAKIFLEPPSTDVRSERQQQISPRKMKTQDGSFFCGKSADEVVNVLVEQRLIRVVSAAAASAAAATSAALVIVVVGAKFFHVPDADGFI